MNRSQPLDRLDLDDHLVGNDEIESVMAYQLPAIRNRNVFLGFKGDSGSMQLDGDGPRACALEQSGAKFAVHPDATANRLVNQFLDFIRQRTWYAQHSISSSCLRAFVVMVAGPSAGADP
jgi:hypothetical protein